MKRIGAFALVLSLGGCGGVAGAQAGLGAATTIQGSINAFATTAATANIDLAGSVLGACITNLQTLKTQAAEHTTPAAP